MSARKGTAEEERAAAKRVYRAAAELTAAMEAAGELGLRVILETVDVTCMDEFLSLHRREVVLAKAERVEQL